MDNFAAWEAHAQDWIQWAQPENQDGFWTDTWPTMREMLPAPGGLVLDLGCGEGRGLRQLRGLGYDVLGVERAPTLAAAAAVGCPLKVVLADASRLPVRSGAVAVVFACMSLLDIAQLTSTLHEVRRVLQPGGALVAAVVHPFISAFDNAARREGELTQPAPYFTTRTYQDHAVRDGRPMTFTSIHRPLRDYVEPLLSSGFALTNLREVGDGPLPWLFAFRADLRPAR